MAELYRIEADHLELVWPDVVRLLRPHAELVSPEPLRSKLLLGERFLWLALTATPRYSYIGLVITGFSYHSKDAKPTLTIHFVAGRKIASWIPSAITQLARYAGDHGITRAYIRCRKGWKSYARLVGERFEEYKLMRDRPTNVQLRKKALRHVVPKH